jgi:hypothetical protein
MDQLDGHAAANHLVVDGRPCGPADRGGGHDQGGPESLPSCLHQVRGNLTQERICTCDRASEGLLDSIEGGLKSEETEFVYDVHSRRE